ncbi:hypothetical protein BH09PAT1_BH09PAT1_7880 [soil metagenome]
MKLDKLELSALLGMQARNRELVFMMEQIKLQLENLEVESTDLFSDIEMRLKMEPDTLINYDVDTETGEVIVRKEPTSNVIPIASNGHSADFDDITELDEIN